jgi:hypothetical protein
MDHLTAIGILDLPDEILLTIFNKLNNIEMLYSFIGVNQKLDKLFRNIVFTSRSLDFVAMLSSEENNTRMNSILNRFCVDILPQIQHNIECLTLEPSLIERVLYSCNYPKLRKLTLVNLQLKIASHILTGMYLITPFDNGRNKIFPYICYIHLDESLFVHKFKHNISHLTFKINDDITNEYKLNLVTKVYARIFVIFTNLIHLEFDLEDTCGLLPSPFYQLPSTSCYSSSIVYLHVEVDCLEDCLYLLDGRLSQLHTFIVKVGYMSRSSMIGNKTVKNFNHNEKNFFYFVICLNDKINRT